MPLLQLVDNFAIDAKDLRKTGDGYMVAMPRVARTGIQLYTGDEVGRPDLSVVRVYRPEAEVFNTDSMQSFAFKPITNNHPPKPVTSDNWKQFSVGLAGGEVARDGEFIRIPMTVMDGKAIKDVEGGKAELSVGYSTELKWGTGVTPDTNEKFDAIQTAIHVNHIAIVDAARGGSKLRIGDLSAPGPYRPQADAAATDGVDDMSDANKTLVTVMVDGISCQMDATYAAIVQKTMKDLADKLNASTAQITTLTGDAAKAKAEYDAAIAKLTTEGKTALDAATAKITTLEKQVSDATLSTEKLEALVKDRAELLGKAKAVLGDKLVVDKKSDGEIRRQVVDAKLGETAKGWTDDQVKVSFDTICANVQVPNTSGVVDTARAFSNQTSVPQPGNWNNDAKNKAYNERDKKLSEAWKGTPAQH